MMLEADEQKELRGRAASGSQQRQGDHGRRVGNASVGRSTRRRLRHNAGSERFERQRKRPTRAGASAEWRKRSSRQWRFQRRWRQSDACIRDRLAAGSRSSKTADTSHIPFPSADDACRRDCRHCSSRATRNGDGQVSMSEYSRSWSSRTVAEFQRYDRNDDGMITAKEAAK